MAARMTTADALGREKEDGRRTSGWNREEGREGCLRPAVGEEEGKNEERRTGF